MIIVTSFSIFKNRFLICRAITHILDHAATVQMKFNKPFWNIQRIGLNSICLLDISARDLFGDPIGRRPHVSNKVSDCDFEGSMVGSWYVKTVNSDAKNCWVLTVQLELHWLKSGLETEEDVSIFWYYLKNCRESQYRRSIIVVHYLR